MPKFPLLSKARFFSWTLHQRFWVWQSLVFVAVFLIALAFPPASQPVREVLFNVLQMLAAWIGGVVGVLWTRRPEGTAMQRRGWRVISLASLCFAIGQSVWTYYECVAQIEVPFPSLADCFWLVNSTLMLCGVSLLFGGMRVVGRLRLLLDSAIATSSFGVLIWYFVIGPLWNQSDAPLLTKILGIAYPLFDIASLFGAVVLLHGASRDPSMRLRIGLLCAGLVMIASADVGFNVYTMNETFQTGSWPDAGWGLAYVCIGYACLLPLLWPQFFPREVEESAARARSGDVEAPRHVLLGAVAPYLAVISAFALIAVQDYTQSQGRISNSVFGIGWVLILLVIVRQVFTLLENQRTLGENARLTAQLRAFNENLEATVERRTAQLRALHKITRDVNNSLETDQVLSAAARHLPDAIPSQALVFRLLDENGGNAAPLRFQWQQGLEGREDVARFLLAQPVPQGAQVLALPPSGSVSDPEIRFLCAPLSRQGHVMGMVSLIRSRGGFGAGEPELLESIALAVGTALENARHFAAVREAQQNIKVSLQEKEVLLKEIHHRVKNNMQVISSMLNMQSDFISDPQALEMFRDSQNRIRSMALIHERLYGSTDLAHIDFGDYLRDLISNLLRSYRRGRVEIEMELEAIPLDIDTAVPCGLIVNEVVSNILKHAFSPQRGAEDENHQNTIFVTLRAREGAVQLRVRDNGVGFPLDVDFRETESLGLQLVTSLTEQIEGTIELERNPDGQSGTQWTITLPRISEIAIDLLPKSLNKSGE